MIYGRPFEKAEEFLPAVRKLGGGFTRMILFWSQSRANITVPLDSYLD